MAKQGEVITLCDNCGKPCDPYELAVELDRQVRKQTVYVRTAYRSPDLCEACFAAILTSAVRVRYEQTWFPFIVATACAWALLIYLWSCR